MIRSFFRSRSSRRCCAGSGRRSWSASTGPTRNGGIRWPGLELSIDAQRAAHAAIHALAHDLAGGRWLLTGGGGYELVHVVPRTWTHLLAEAAGQPIDPRTPTPARWREHVARRTGLTAPEHMTEGEPAGFEPFESGYDPADPVDRAIMTTRKAVFAGTG